MYHKLLALYSLATRDYAWIRAFYPVARLREACEALGCPFRVLHPADFDGTAAADEAVLVRGLLPPRTWAALEGAPTFHVNRRAASRLADNKALTYRFLTAHGYPAIRSVVISEADSAHLTERIDEAGLALPLVVKPCFGHSGRGVRLVRTVGDLCTATAEAVRFSSSVAGAAGASALVQEWLGYSCGEDRRVFVAGGEVLAVVGRQSLDGFASNRSRGARTYCAAIGDEYRAMAVSIVAEMGLHYGAVDFLYRDEHRMAVCEVNASAGFEGIEREAGLDIARPLVASILRVGMSK